MPTLGVEDIWTGETSSSLRRLVQNRLNQRASRQRKLKQEQDAGVTRRLRGRPKAPKVKPQLEPSAVASPAAETQLIQLKSPSQHMHTHTNVNITLEIFECNNHAGITKFVKDLTSFVLSQMSHGDPSADLLLHVTRLNSLRAIISNMTMLELPLNEVCADESISRFNSYGWNISALPSSLRPTPKQLSIPHHPWIDIFPFPSLRDKFISFGEYFDDTDLCNDALGLYDSKAAGLLVWSDPWDAYGWEMTDEFATKWFWVFKHCIELCASTDYWRAKRGEPGLCITNVWK